MSEYDKADRDCETIQKQHGPGGQLPPECYFNPESKVALAEKSKDVSWAPVKPSQNEVDRIKSISLRLIPYAAASGIVFWWQQTEQLADTAGFWALIVLALLGGLSIGRCCNG